MKVEETSVCFLALDAKYKSRLNHSINITFQHDIILCLKLLSHSWKEDHTTRVWKSHKSKESVLHDTTYQFSNLSMKTTILVTNRWNRSHLSWIFSKFLTFTLHTFVLTQMCRSPSPMLSRAYFGALKWLQTQINIGEGKITQVFQDLWRGL